jgi:serine/threonine protein kinase
MKLTLQTIKDKDKTTYHYCAECKRFYQTENKRCEKCQKTCFQSVAAYPAKFMILEKYEIIGLLGFGGMGMVYHAKELPSQREVALKFIHPSLLQDGEILSRFRREGTATSQIEHPNVLSVWALEETRDGDIFLVLEYLDGRDLDQYCQENEALSLHRIVSLIVQLLEALDATHSRGVIHRDIKPQNLFLYASPQGLRVKLFDFGMAKLLAQPGDFLTPKGMTLGTPAYMAPEQVCGGEVDARTDLWSVGVVLYFLLTGKQPFCKATPIDTTLSVINDPLIPPSARAPERNVPKPLEDLCIKALSKDPAKRPQSAAAFRDELLRAMPPEAVATPTQEATEELFIPNFKGRLDSKPRITPLQRETTTRTRGWLLLTLLVVLVGFTGAWYAFPRTTQTAAIESKPGPAVADNAPPPAAPTKNEEPPKEITPPEPQTNKKQPKQKK